MASTSPRSRCHPAVLALVVAGLAIPLVVTLVAVHEPRWFPNGDMAMIEMNVHDVAGSRPPLVGLLGRFGTPGNPGHHPGPLGFFSLWPVYTLAGGGSWALHLSGGFLSALAVAGTCWIASRRGGAALVLGVAAALAALMVAYGPVIPVTPWNPYQPVFWWPVVLLGVWSVLEDDLVVLPLAVFAASLCAQTHISYVGLVGGLGLLAAAVLIVRAVRRRSDRDELRRLALWAGGSVALGCVLWLPPVAQQIFGARPNLSILFDEFSRSTEPALGLRTGLELMAAHLDPVRLVTGHTTLAFGRLRAPTGIASVLAWAAAAAVSLRLPDRRLRHLHAVVGTSLLLGLVSASTIHGPFWDYLMLWAWALGAFVLVATGWTAVAAARAVVAGRGTARPVRALNRAVPIAAAVSVVALTVPATIRAADANPGAQQANRLLGGVAPDAIAALKRSDTAGRGRDGRYLVDWDDPVTMFNLGIGLMNEMRRSGLDVGIVAPRALSLSNRWARSRAEATAVVNLSVGPAVSRWRSCPGATELAAYDPRTPAQRAKSDRLYRRVQAELAGAGLTDLVPLVRVKPRTVMRDPRLATPDRADLLARVFLTLKADADLGFPVAVFTGPPDLTC
ncbi:MAG: hypothetical protein KJ056_01770 [Acidimicrobiia bacterium]|nr:hypothetical protein [Acidimicrobiia bacterium]